MRKTLLPILLGAVALVLATLNAGAVECVDPLKLIPRGCTPKAGTGEGGSDTVMAALAKPFQDLSAFLQSDAAGAIALATQIPDLQDGHGQQCWMAMQVAGEVFKAHPVPLTLHAMTDFEALRLLGMSANKLCANTHCTVVFADATSMAQAASPIPLPIPSLHDLCAKIPQISLAPPVPVSTPATPVPPATPSEPQ